MGCGSDPRGVKLSDVDLSDMGTVQEVRAQLSAEDGAAFASYVVKHHIASPPGNDRTKPNLRDGLDGREGLNPLVMKRTGLQTRCVPSSPSANGVGFPRMMCSTHVRRTD